MSYNLKSDHDMTMATMDTTIAHIMNEQEGPLSAGI